MSVVRAAQVSYQRARKQVELQKQYWQLLQQGGNQYRSEYHSEEHFVVKQIVMDVLDQESHVHFHSNNINASDSKRHRLSIIFFLSNLH